MSSSTQKNLIRVTLFFFRDTYSNNTNCPCISRLLCNHHSLLFWEGSFQQHELPLPTDGEQKEPLCNLLEKSAVPMFSHNTVRIEPLGPLRCCCCGSATVTDGTPTLSLPSPPPALPSLPSPPPSTLSSCIHAVVALLYPFSWQHTFIPVLPASMVDIVCCPTPFLVGLLSSSLPKLKDLPVEEVGTVRVHPCGCVYVCVCVCVCE